MRKGAQSSPAGDLSVIEMAGLLRVAEATVAEHVERGAPVDGEGRLNVVYYAAWLIQQITASRLEKCRDGQPA